MVIAGRHNWFGVHIITCARTALRPQLKGRRCSIHLLACNDGPSDIGRSRNVGGNTTLCVVGIAEGYTQTTLALCSIVRIICIEIEFCLNINVSTVFDIISCHYKHLFRITIAQWFCACRKNQHVYPCACIFYVLSFLNGVIFSGPPSDRSMFESMFSGAPISCIPVLCTSIIWREALIQLNSAHQLARGSDCVCCGAGDELIFI